MACCDETVIFERMALEEGSCAVERRCMDFARGIVKDYGIKIPHEMQMEVEKLVMDKAKQFASVLKDVIDEIQTRKAPAETVDKKIQSEKMDKAPVQTEKIQPEKMDKAPGVIDKNQTERSAGKYRLDADSDYVRSILAMPTEVTYEIPYSRGDNIGELLGVTEEWLEEKRQGHREAAARAERISSEFALFQDKVRDETDRLGYFEVDDEYLDGVAALQEYSNELGKGKKTGGFKFYDPDRCNPAKELCSVK